MRTGVKTAVPALMVKVRTLLAPAEVVRVTFRGPVAALLAMVNVAVTCEAVEPMLLIEIPAMALIEAPARFDPARVTLTAVPRTPLDGVIEVNAGGGVLMVKEKALLVPAEVVTETFCCPAIVPAATAKVAVI